MERKMNDRKAHIPCRKAVTIKYGDVVVSVEGETPEQAKKDAMELFGMLEEKYQKSWEKKVCTEKTRYD
ncbi:MAG: hypothetical protein N3E51_04710 [Candidatus Micrarchaeota archaeon]|nr:hypothetical protein [Candidatus Micrarchaeota archaeon]